MDNSIELEPTENIVEVSVIEVESIYEFVTPVQVVVEKREVGGSAHSKKE